MSEAVGYAQRDGIAEIVLDDGKVNAMSAALFDGFNTALDRAVADGSGAVVIAGPPALCSAGLTTRRRPPRPAEEPPRPLLSFGGTLLGVWTSPLPPVAAVTGHAVAGGAMLAFACDRRFVADGPFRIQLNETAIGLTLPTWALVICESVIPVRWHAEAMLHARPFSPAEALAREMIDDAVTADAVVERAREAASALTALDRGAYAATKRRLRSRAVAWAEQHLEAEMAALPIRASG